MARVLYLILAVVVAGAGLAFDVRNKQIIEVDYFIGRAALEVSSIAVAALLIGVVLGVIAMTSIVFGLRRELRRAKRGQRLVQRELEGLRATALKDVA